MGAFVGFNYLQQMVKAYGCTQTATNPDVCVPTIDSSVLGITQTNKWRSLRLGVSGDIRTGRLQLGGEAALTYSRLTGSDAHWLRIGTDPGETSPVRFLRTARGGAINWKRRSPTASPMR